jgi:hypothetical protein
MHIESKNLLFLLTAAPMALPLGCLVSVGDDTSSNGDEIGETSGDGDTAGDGDGDTTGDGDGDTSGDGDGDGDTSGDGDGDTTGDGDGDTTGDGDGDTTGGGDTACTAYADLVETCGGTAAEAYMYCVDYSGFLYDNYGADCLAAYEDFLVCISELSCDEFGGPDPFCETESAFVDSACFGP